MNQKNKLPQTPTYSEPKTKNRWIVEINDISSHRIQSIEFEFKKNWFHNPKIIIRILEVIGVESIFKKFVNNKSKYNIKFAQLDPLGDIIDGFLFKNCKVKNVIPSSYDYSDDDIDSVEIHFTYSKFDFLFE